MKRDGARLDAHGRWTSAGRRLLLAALKEWTASELAAACGVTMATISALSTGVNREPRLRLALKLERVAKIDVHWWDEPSEAISIPIDAAGATVQSKPQSAA